MSADDYTKSMNYEILIRRAFNCPSGMRNGAHLSFMQNAISMERGETYAKHLGSFKKQFQKVKTYTSKALLKLAKTKPYSGESHFFQDLNDEINDVHSTQELLNIVNNGLDKVVALKKP